MKKLIAVLGLMVGLSGVSHAGLLHVGSDVAESFKSFVNESHVRFLDNATPCYFYDVQNGESRGGIITSFFEYGFLSAEAGYLSPSVDVAADRTGSPLLGGSFHIDQFIGYVAPQVTTFVYSITPETAHGFMKKVNIGFGAAHDFTRESFTFGVYSGLRF